MPSSILILYKRNFIFLALCLAGLLILGLAGLRPLYLQAGKLDLQISKLQAELNKQQQLALILTVIDHKLANNRQTDMPSFKQAPLPIAEANRILPDIKKIAQDAHLKISTIAPILKNKGTDWRRPAINTELQGHLTGLREFLLNFLTLPYVRGIDRISIQSTDNQLLIHLTFTVLLS